MVSIALHGHHAQADATAPASGCSIDTLATGAEWDALLRSIPEATIFHSSAWGRVLRDAYGHRPHYLRIRKGTRELALVPVTEVASRITGRRGVCAPFADHCGPLMLVESDHQAVFAALGEYARMHRWKHLEVRDGRHRPAGAWPEATYQMHSINLSGGVEALWESLDPAARRSVRKAIAAGLQVASGTTSEFVRDYYRLHQMTRRRHGLPPQPLRFFMALQRHVLAPGLGTVFLVHDRGRPVAGAVFLRWQGSAIYKFGASDPRSLPFRPNHLLMWSAIKALTDAGCASLSLGRSAVGNDGLARFKASWGGRATRLDYLRYRPTQGWAGRGRHPSEAPRPWFASCPLWFARAAGTCLYPHLS